MINITQREEYVGNDGCVIQKKPPTIIFFFEFLNRKDAAENSNRYILL